MQNLELITKYMYKICHQLTLKWLPAHINTINYLIHFLMFYQQNDDTPVSLMEMRFHIPTSELAGDMDAVEAFHQQVMNKASVISVSGDAIAIFRELQCLTPRYAILFMLSSIFLQIWFRQTMQSVWWPFDKSLGLCQGLRIFFRKS